MTTIDPSWAAAQAFGCMRAGSGLGRWASSRGARVCTLVSVIVVLSLADLYLTLLYLRSVGMGEANPLVHMILTHLSVEALAAWKIFTVALASMILVTLRKVRCAEFASWACAIGLCVLTVHWYRYSREVSQLTPVIHQMASLECAQWIHDPR